MLETQEHESKHKVRIHIDEKPYESPNPTTGEALYALGHVPAGFELYREVHGDREDPPIPNATKTVHLQEDEHFHSGPPREVTIIVNGTPHGWSKPEITYAEVVTLDVPDYPQHPEITYSVKYTRGPRNEPEGILAPNASVEVRNREVFSVSPTGQS